MTWVDNIKNFFKREPRSVDDGGEYNASYPGNYSNSSGWWGSRGDGSKWTQGMSLSGSSPVLDHYMLRQNARSAMYDSMQARAIVERYADVVIDTGLILESTPAADVLQIEPEAAEKWAADVERRFGLWAGSKQSDYAQSQNFYQLQRLLEIAQQRDGEYFVRLFYSDDPNLISPLQLQMIDPNQINGYGFTDTYGFQCDDDGIQRDQAGKEIGYNVRIREKNYQYHNVMVPAISPKSGLPLMIHGFQPEYAGQGRGFSRLSHAVQYFEKLTDFESAHIQKAINHASTTMYVKPSAENDASDPFDAVPSRQFGAVPEVPVTAQSVDPASTLDLGSYLQYQDVPEAVLSRPGVGVFSLRSGEDLKAFQDTTPSEQYDQFVNAFTSYLSASMSMPIEAVLMKFGQNYSASRAALIMLWRVAQVWQAELAADFLNPVYDTWLSLEIGMGRIVAPGWQDPIMRCAWTQNTWIGAPMPDIDPLRHSKANKEYAAVGATDLDRIARNVNGSVGASNRSKLKRQVEELPVMPWEQKKTPGQ